MPCQFLPLVRRINRIRLEFKDVAHNFIEYRFATVLIESDWNLKLQIQVEKARKAAVLIESDWNLKLMELSKLVR